MPRHRFSVLLSLPLTGGLPDVLGLSHAVGGADVPPLLAAYVTGAMAGAYVLLGLALVVGAAWLAVRWQRQRSEARQHALEHEVELRTREAEAQKKMLQHLNANLRNTNTRLEELSEQKSNLLSIAAHDLKAPLTSIYSLADILLEERDRCAPNWEFVELIQQTARDMSNLIENVLSSAATEMGQVNMQFVHADLAELAGRAAGQCLGLAERKGQQLRFRVAHGQGRFEVVGDEMRLMEVMTNLVSNAVKYTPLEGQIDVEVVRDADWVCFRVTDTGPGLNEADRERLFQPFQRLTAQPTGGESSSGLGLYIVRQYVELHGGAVGADSEPGEGSTFWFCLPAAEQHVSPDASPVGAAPESRV